MKNLMEVAIFSSVFLVLGFAAGYVVKEKAIEKPLENGQKALSAPSGYSLRKQGGYSYVNPLLECEIAKNEQFIEYSSLKNSVEKYITQSQKLGKATEVAVYFRELDNGSWFGIGEKEEFSPASLLKLPTMITYFKLSEADPSILNRKYTYDGKQDLNASENIKSKNQLSKGQSYTVDELIKWMIVYSDNNARKLLDDNVEPYAQQKTYQDFGLDIPGVTTIKDFTTVKNYASFFRILYNATYLSPDLSEKALEILTKVEFDQGIVAGVPRGTMVAHKFGERVYTDTGANQLHECGIIYHKTRPYLLCIMSRGQKIVDLTDIIKQISFLAYSYVDQGQKTQ